MGYKMVNGKVTVDAERSTIVESIYKDYLDGIPLHKIAEKLTDAGILNANKKPNWNHSSIGRILKDERYIGGDEYPQLIDESVFQKVQERRQSRKETLGEPLKPNSHIRRIEERIKVLEDGKAFSSNELAELIFKRAEAYYNLAKVDDSKHNTEKIIQALKETVRENKTNKTLTTFNAKLFQTITNQIVIFNDGTLKIEYINGISITESCEIEIEI